MARLTSPEEPMGAHDMSIRAMSLVWSHFDGGGSELLAMLALADWASDDGGNIYPSIATIAKKIRLSKRHARRIIHQLIRDHWCLLDEPSTGGPLEKTNRYRLDLNKMRTTSARVPPDIGDTPGARVPPPLAPTSGVPLTPASATPSAGVPQSIINPKGASKTLTRAARACSKDRIEEIYQTYPRRVGRKKALIAIEKAVQEIAKREGTANAGAWLLGRVKEFAASPAGQAGTFTPHPATWMNQGRYDDDPAEWSRKDDRDKPKAGGRIAAPPGKYAGLAVRSSDDR